MLEEIMSIALGCRRKGNRNWIACIRIIIIIIDLCQKVSICLIITHAQMKRVLVLPIPSTRLIVQSVMSSAETISNLPVCRVASNGDSHKAKRLSKFIDTKSSVVYRVASSLISTNILIGN